MKELMNVGSLVFGLIAWILPAVNLAQHNKISSKKYAAFTVTSLSLCAVSLCLQLFYTDHLVRTEDWSALLDTSHVTALVAALFLVVTIILNVSALLVHFEKDHKKDIIANGRVVKGVVTATKTLYWLTVNKNAIRMNNADSSHPHMVYFKYSIDGIDFEGKGYMNWTVPEFNVGQQINVYISKDNPKEYALNY